MKTTEQAVRLILPDDASAGYGTALTSLDENHVLFTCIVGAATVRLVKLRVADGATELANGLKGSLRDAVPGSDGYGCLLTEYGLHTLRVDPLRIEKTVRVPSHMSDLHRAGTRHIAASRWFSKVTVIYDVVDLAEERRLALPTDLVLEREDMYAFCSFQTGSRVDCGPGFEPVRRGKVPLGRTPVDHQGFVFCIAGAPTPGDVPEPQRHVRVIKLERETFAEVARVEALGVQRLLGCDRNGLLVAQSARGIMLFDPKDLSLLASHDTERIVVTAVLVGPHSAAVSFHPQFAGGVSLVRWSNDTA